MKFCPKDSFHLKEFTATGKLQFKCDQCQSIYESEPSDTLLTNIDYSSSESGEKYKVLLENAPYDPSGKKIVRKCANCKSPIMYPVYIKGTMKLYYTCKCGYVEDPNAGKK
jgi:DNA-directed RNA polymerase subunit M/transcription elongation factor TFIIS